MEKTAEYSRILSQMAEKNGHPQELALSDFLDFLLNFYDVRHYAGDVAAFQAHVRKQYDEQPEYFGLMLSWAGDVAGAHLAGHWVDMFGSLYEDLYLSRGKASSTGQFFTPGDVSDLMSELVMGRAPEIKAYTVNDCAAGSGRLLLSHYMKASREDRNGGRAFWYEAGDCDPVACKMCALNMMIHGMQGRVVCQNTLTLDTPKVVYYINEVRYPIATPYYSIRQVVPEKKAGK